MAKKEKNMRKAEKQAAFKENIISMREYFAKLETSPADCYAIGIDPSTTSYGVVVLDAQRDVVHEELIAFNSSKINNTDKRLIIIRDRVSEILEEMKERDICIDLVVMEGYSYNSPNSAALSGEHGFLTRAIMWDNEIVCIRVPPLRAKKYAGGLSQKNPAVTPSKTKDLMIKSVYKNYDYDTDVSDMADAFAFGVIGIDLIRYILMCDDKGNFEDDMSGESKRQAPVKKFQKEVLYELVVNGALYLNTIDKDFIKINLNLE